MAIDKQHRLIARPFSYRIQRLKNGVIWRDGHNTLGLGWFDEQRIPRTRDTWDDMEYHCAVRAFERIVKRHRDLLMDWERHAANQVREMVDRDILSYMMAGMSAKPERK